MSTIFGSDLPLKPILSSGKELVIKFKSHIRDGPYHMNNTQATFLMSYHTEYIGNLQLLIERNVVGIKCIKSIYVLFNRL